MRNLISIAAALCAASLAAQSPLSLPFAANNGLAAGSCIYFDLSVTTPAGITLTTLDVNTGATTVGTIGSVEVYTTPTTYVGSQQVPGNWTLAASGPVMAQGDNAPSPACLGAGVYLPQGSYGIAVRHVGVALRYTGTTTTLPVPNSVTTAEATLSCGQSQATLFSSTPIAARVFNGNVYYNIGNVPGLPCTAFATKTTYGTGCYQRGDSWYESFAQLQNFDLAGTPGNEQVVGATFAGPPGYLVAAGTPAWFSPASSPMLSNATTPAAMTDDTMSGPRTLPFTFSFPGGSTNVIHACVNGFVVLGATTATTGDYAPTTAEMLAQPARLFALWGDWQAATNLPTNPASGVYYDVDPSNQTVYVTWLDLADRRAGVPAAGVSSINVQCALHANGTVEFRYRNMVPWSSGNGVVMTGISKGNTLGSASVDPGAVDISTAMPFVTNGPDSAPLALDSNAPRLGQNWTMTTTHFEPVSPVGVQFFGDTQLNPGIDLSIIGAPGCSGYTNANLYSTVFPVVAGTGTLTLALPSTPALGGILLTVQSVGFTTLNPLGLNTSNGLAATLGQ